MKAANMRKIILNIKKKYFEKITIERLLCLLYFKTSLFSPKSQSIFLKRFPRISYEHCRYYLKMLRF